MNNATASSDSFKPMNISSLATAASTDNIISSSSSSSFVEYIQSISFTTWLIILLLLALLGFNIFAYLAKGTQSINEIFGPAFKKIMIALGLTASQTVDVAASGTKAVVNTTADVTDASLTTVQNVLPTNNVSTTNRALNSQKAAMGSNTSYQEDDATSNIQMGSSKSGYCFIGEDRGYRSCAYVSESDKCISGEIFPSNEICINPNLRT